MLETSFLAVVWQMVFNSSSDSMSFLPQKVGITNDFFTVPDVILKDERILHFRRAVGVIVKDRVFRHLERGDFPRPVRIVELPDLSDEIAPAFHGTAVSLFQHLEHALGTDFE